MRTIQRFDGRIDQLGFDLSIPVENNEIMRFRRAQQTQPEKVCEKQSFVNDQVHQFVAWRDKCKPSGESQTEHTVTKPIQVQPTREAFPSTERTTQEKIQMKKNQQYIQPRGRSTLLDTKRIAEQSQTNRVSIDVQDTNPTYVFSRNNRNTNTTVTSSSTMNQRSTSDQLKNTIVTSHQQMFTSGAVNGVETSRNDGSENQYYETLHSFHNPVGSVGQRDHEYENQALGNGCMSYYKPISSSRAFASGVRAPLTPSQIVARHAIPKDLPPFSGNPKDWCRFIKRYTNSTVMCGYTDDENLERLDKCLRDKARTLVESLLLMPNSVPEIVDTLYEKYGRPELVIKQVLQDVRSYPAIKPDKLELLSDFGYAVRNACNQIEDLQLLNYLHNPELIQEIIEKLPYQTRIDWARYSECKPVVTLRILADWLHKLSKTINRITSPDFPTSSSEQKSFNSNKNDRKGDNSRNENTRSGYVYVHEQDKTVLNAEKSSECRCCGKQCKSLENCVKFKSLDVDQRWKLLLSNKLCRKCLQFHRRNCHTSKECGVNGCEIKHHSLLHNDQRHSKDDSTKSNATPNRDTKYTDPNKKNPEKVINSGRNNTHHLDNGELFRVVPVELYVNDRKVSTYAYLDEGSSFTLMERNVADKLGISGTPETICLLWTNNVHRQEESEVVNLKIAGVTSESSKRPSVKYELENFHVVQDLNLPEQSLPLDTFRQRYEHLRNIPIVGYENITPTLLIGIKHARLAVPLETVEGKGNDPIATRSRLGWSVYGPLSNTSIDYVNAHRIAKCSCIDRDDETHKMIKDHFTIENFGVVENAASLDSKENDRALLMMKNGTISVPVHKKGTIQFHTIRY